MVKIALVGLANVGKTTFLNTLTGSNLKTANFAGSTTSKKEIAIFHKGKTITFYDLPGFNSFTSKENDLAKNTIKTLKEGNFDAIIHIVNAEFPYFSTILAQELKEELGAKVITAINFPSFKLSPNKAEYGFEKAILFSALSKQNCDDILEIVLKEIEGESFNSNNLLKFKNQFNSVKVSNLIDKIALSKIFGLPFFFGIMFFIFWFSFIVGKAIGDFFTGFFDFGIEWIEGLAFLPHFLRAIFKSIIVGVGTVVGFIPTIVICTTLIGILEQTGYVTRISFLLDKLFEKFGLGGKSLIPLIIGAGCSITAYMSSRMINDPKEKFLTMVIIGFIPCTAKLAVFMLFCLALFGENAPIALFLIYTAGFFVGLVCAKLLGMVMKGEAYSIGQAQKTKIEIFNYRLPIFKNVLKTGISRTADYLKNAATFITIFSAIISFLGVVGFEGLRPIILEDDGLENSIIGMIGKALMPIFYPMDFDFKVIISLITGLVAKEMAVATLAVLYSSTTEGLAQIIQNEIGLRRAVSYLVFMFFYLPCVSATMSFHKEVKDGKKTAFLIIFTFALAYFFATISNLIFLLF
jgi:ferrous iron transport protein B